MNSTVNYLKSSRPKADFISSNWQLTVWLYFAAELLIWFCLYYAQICLLTFRSIYQEHNFPEMPMPHSMTKASQQRAGLVHLTLTLWGVSPSPCCSTPNSFPEPWGVSQVLCRTDFELIPLHPQHQFPANSLDQRARCHPPFPMDAFMLFCDTHPVGRCNNLLNYTFAFSQISQSFFMLPTKTYHVRYSLCSHTHSKLSHLPQPSTSVTYSSPISCDGFTPLPRQTPPPCSLTPHHEQDREKIWQKQSLQVEIRR